MTITLEEIKAPIANELNIFEKKFREAMKSKVPLLDRIMHYIVKSKGKQMRPMFVFLSAKLFGEIGPSTYNAASLIELLHTATLVHDDVVDDAHERRGFFSINALWKNKIAVLVGDYLLSKGLLLSIDNNEIDLLQIVSKAVKEMSEGELLQIEKTRKLNIKEDIYYEIIRQKTATLIASACASGTASVSPEKENIDKMWTFGEKIGIAFQIKDDLLDYGDTNTGKAKGIDIKERKLTLPLIYALQEASKSDRRHIINIIKNHNKNSRKVQEVIDFVVKSGGIDYSREAMQRYQEEALETLNGMNNSEARSALEKLIRYTTDRKK